MGEERTDQQGADRASHKRPPEPPTVNIRRRLTVSEAADELGISAEAVRSRVKRGTLRSTKEGGTVYVLLPTSVDDDQTATGRARTMPEHDQAADQTDTRPDPREELVESLLDQVAYMREQLAQEREARRRADTIIVQLTQANAVLAGRVPEIEAPRGEPGGHRSASEDEAGTEAPGDDTDEPRRSSWWRRWFG